MCFYPIPPHFQLLPQNKAVTSHAFAALGLILNAGSLELHLLHSKEG